MNKFNYSNTLKCKRNKQFSNNKNSIKSHTNVRIQRYTLHCHAYMVSGVTSLINKCFNMNGLPH